MFTYIASADVGVVSTEPTSVSYRFSLPNKLFESMMAGLPVVVSDLPEQAALVRRTGAGVLYKARSDPDGDLGTPEAIAEAVETLLTDPVLHATCRERALEAARTELNWDRESRRLVQLYDDLSTLA
jgi:glycosyltransferase involved in cell wall biosynthesis